MAGRAYSLQWHDIFFEKVVTLVYVGTYDGQTRDSGCQEEDRFGGIEEGR